MDDKIDPQLAFLLDATDQADVPLADFAESHAFGIQSAGAKNKPATAEVEVLVQATCEASVLEKAGLAIRSDLGDVFTGVIRLDRLEKLVKLEGVELVEGARPMAPELDLAIVDTRANLVHSGPPGRRGSGVIVGIVDTGIDFTHPAFRNSDGTSRILFIWDQSLNRTGSEVSPAPFGYGVEYSRAQINAALAAPNPFATVRHQVGAFDHGTHVAGIAAGNGRGSSASQPEFRFMGVAPEADIIVVRHAGNGAEGLGTSANALDAVNYCYQKAQSLDRAAVVNMSLGDNLGPHDGTSLLERGLDNLLGQAGRAFVKSAGNVGSARHHAGGTLAQGATASVGFNQPAGNSDPDVLDFWYTGASSFRVRVEDSAGNATAEVAPGAAQTFTLASGNTVRIDHRNNDPFNSDKRVFVTITRGTVGTILAGNWLLRLRSISSAGGGRFDGWIQRGNNVPTFRAPFESNDRTISTPGTALKVITVANYGIGAPLGGGLAGSSSRGPTRDNRSAPTLAAPGSGINSAASNFGSGNPYRSGSGTSMSAPHVAGVIALMFQKNRSRTQEQIRACLTSTARSDGFTGPVPNTAWGAGKVDAKAAVDCVPLQIAPPGSVVIVQCPSAVQVRCPTRVVAQCPSVVQVRCPTRVQAQCPPSVVQVRCPTLVQALCFTRVPAQCPQPPRTNPFPCPQTTPLTCQVQTSPMTCLQQTSPVVCLRQTTPITCLQQTLPNTCGGPSIVDGCPSTPGGCNFGTVVINPALTGVQPGVFSPEVEQAALAAAEAAYWAALQGMMGPMMDPGAADAGGEYGAADLPEGGYFEYDESWFEPDGSDGSGSEG